jgi:NinG protein
MLPKTVGLSRGSKLARTKTLKRKPTSSLKRAKKTPEAKLKAELWQLCKQIIRLKYGNTCYTCAAHPLVGSNWHTGHFVASSICGAYLRYDLRNLRPQCYRCNVSLVGNGAVFYRNMAEREGSPYVEGIFADKERDTRLTRTFLQEKIDEYTKSLHTLQASVDNDTPPTS